MWAEPGRHCTTSQDTGDEERDRKLSMSVLLAPAEEGGEFTFRDVELP